MATWPRPSPKDFVARGRGRPAAEMVACAAHYDKLEKTTAELGVRPLHNALEVVTAADVVIIAIKPYQIAAVVKPVIGRRTC